MEPSVSHTCPGVLPGIGAPFLCETVYRNRNIGRDGTHYLTMHFDHRRSQDRLLRHQLVQRLHQVVMTESGG